VFLFCKNALRKSIGSVLKEYIADRERLIHVYDDVFDLAYKQKIYDFVQKSFFRIGWADGVIAEKNQYQFLHSTYSEEDLEKLGYIQALKDSEVAQELVGHKISKAVVNLSTPSDANFIHAHPEDKVILYYVNLEWLDGWHGETLFYSESFKDIVFASPYTPGRIIAFNAKIPHTIRPQSSLASHYRFTFALVLTEC
jgi:hypothetical protein